MKVLGFFPQPLVSILVLMDVTLQQKMRYITCLLMNVSILVLMDVTLQPHNIKKIK